MLLKDPNLPYTVNYDHTDEYGTRIYRLEITDADNVRMGTYGYMDAKGLYRQVHYLADTTGFHVFVCTNEPGTETSYPADAVIQMHHWEKVEPDSTLGRLLAKLPQVTSLTTVNVDGKGKKKRRHSKITNANLDRGMMPKRKFHAANVSSELAKTT